MANTTPTPSAPVRGQLYALTGTRDTPCIMNGNSWEESRVKKEYPPLKVEIDVDGVFKAIQTSDGRVYKYENLQEAWRSFCSAWGVIGAPCPMPPLNKITKVIGTYGREIRVRVVPALPSLAEQAAEVRKQAMENYKQATGSTPLGW